MILNELSVAPQTEQDLFLENGYIAKLRFDMIYKRWFFDLYYADELVYAGLALNPDTFPLAGISEVTLGLADIVGDKEEYEPYSELGKRLSLLEAVDEGN